MVAMSFGAIVLKAVLLSAVLAVQTVYTLPQNVHWLPLTGPGVPRGGSYAMLRGKSDGACDSLMRIRFPDGYVFPWHVNHGAGIYIVQSGTLVIGFDKNHSRAKERALPAGSVMQGLATEPHYGRAIGDTVFDVYIPCQK